MNTIYRHSPTYSLNPSIDLIAALASEARVCEQLLSLGYTHSNEVDLKKRLGFLRQKISECEDILYGADQYARSRRIVRRINRNSVSKFMASFKE